MRDFIAALQFLTTIRVAQQEVRNTQEFARSMLYFPLVGLIVGIIMAGIGYGAALKLPSALVGAILLVTEIIVTGGLHLDGYMDTMDGIFSGRSKDRILEIMKDSRVGAHAVIALGGLFVFKYALFTQIIALKAWPVLLLMPVLGRLTMGIGTALFPYARLEGLGKGFSEFFTLRHLLFTALYTGLISLVMSWQGLVLWACTALWAWLFARFVSNRIGGLTGDVYGALCELSEVAVLLIAVCLIS